MTKIDKKTVEHLAGLANLELTEAEKTKFASQLGETISYVKRLSELHVRDVPPTSQTTGLKNVFREDIAGPSLTQESALSNTKRKVRGYFVTDKVL